MPAKIKRMNKKFFMGAFISPFIIFGVFLVFYFLGMSAQMMEQLLGCLLDLIGALCFICILAFIILFHYRMWAAIYEKDMKVGSTKVDPVAAVVLLFIPIVGVFWMFKFYSVFVHRMYEKVTEYNDGLEPLPIGGVFTAIPVLRLIADEDGLAVSSAAYADQTTTEQCRRPTEMATDPNEQYVFIICFGENKLVVLTAADGEHIATLDIPSNPIDVVASSQYVFVTSSTSNVVFRYPLSSLPASPLQL